MAIYIPCLEIVESAPLETQSLLIAFFGADYRYFRFKITEDTFYQLASICNSCSFFEDLLPSKTQQNEYAELYHKELMKAEPELWSVFYKKMGIVFINLYNKTPSFIEKMVAWIWNLY